MAFYFSPARLCVPPYFLQYSCDISVHVELNGDGWLAIYLSSLSLLIRLPFFPPTQSFIICPPQSAEFYLIGTAWHASHPLPFQTRLRLFANVSVATFDTVKRRARTVLPNIWSICCFTGPTPPLKMPQGTAPFTFLPCTIG